MSRLNRQLAAIQRDFERGLDALHEARNNVARGEREFLLTNLRTAFRQAAAVHRRRVPVLRLARRMPKS